MTCRVVRRSRLRPEATCVACIAGLRCVAAIFTSLRCRRACWRGALIQMSRVVVLVHAVLPCWCFVAQRARRQRFIHGRTTHHWLVCSIALYILVSYKQLQMLNLLICSRSSFLFSLSSIFHLLVVPEFHSSCCERAVVWMRIRSCRPALHCAQSIGSQLRPSRRNPRYL